MELRKLVHALDEAGRDVRCRGLLAKLGAAEQLGGMAMIQETRDAVLAFRRAAASRPPAGKKGEAPPAAVHTVALAPSFGEAGSNGSMQYYLASCFDKVWGSAPLRRQVVLAAHSRARTPTTAAPPRCVARVQVFMQPSGQVGLLGLLSQHLFLRPLLDRAKVTHSPLRERAGTTTLHTPPPPPQSPRSLVRVGGAQLVPLAYTRERYKTALHDFTESGFTLEHREQLEGVLKVRERPPRRVRTLQQPHLVLVLTLPTARPHLTEPGQPDLEGRQRRAQPAAGPGAPGRGAGAAHGRSGVSTGSRRPSRLRRPRHSSSSSRRPSGLTRGLIRWRAVGVPLGGRPAVPGPGEGWDRGCLDGSSLRLY